MIFLYKKEKRKNASFKTYFSTYYKAKRPIFKVMYYLANET